MSDLKTWNRNRVLEVLVGVGLLALSFSLGMVVSNMMRGQDVSSSQPLDDYGMHISDLVPTPPHWAYDPTDLDPYGGLQGEHLTFAVKGAGDSVWSAIGRTVDGLSNAPSQYTSPEEYYEDLTPEGRETLIANLLAALQQQEGRTFDIVPDGYTVSLDVPFVRSDPDFPPPPSIGDEGVGAPCVVVQQPSDTAPNPDYDGTLPSSDTCEGTGK